MPLDAFKRKLPGVPECPSTAAVPPRQVLSRGYEAGATHQRQRRWGRRKRALLPAKLLRQLLAALPTRSCTGTHWLTACRALPLLLTVLDCSRSFDAAYATLQTAALHPSAAGARCPEQHTTWRALMWHCCSPCDAPYWATDHGRAPNLSQCICTGGSARPQHVWVPQTHTPAGAAAAV